MPFLRDRKNLFAPRAATAPQLGPVAARGAAAAVLQTAGAKLGPGIADYGAARQLGYLTAEGHRITPAGHQLIRRLAAVGQ